MNISGFIVSALLILSNVATDLEIYRLNYSKAVSDKALCEKMISELGTEKDNSAVALGYLGGFQTIWANHVFNPISKLNTFRKGKKNIEEAIQKEPTNVELRFIRLSVQKHAPSFLGYRSKITEDTEYILKNRDKINNVIVNRDIESLLKE